MYRASNNTFAYPYKGAENRRKDAALVVSLERYAECFSYPPLFGSYAEVFNRLNGVEFSPPMPEPSIIGTTLLTRFNNTKAETVLTVWTS